MKLEKFKEKNNKRIGIILFTITCILLISGVILYRTFAIFETNDEFNVINGKVEDMGDVQFVFYIDDEISKSAPEISSDYSLDTTKSHCTNDAMIYWNDVTKRAEVENLSDSKTKCYLYFKQIYKEGILNGAIPDLGNGKLIPITISDNEKPSDVNYEGSTTGGKVRKADITKDWYSYEQKRWANAVILKDGEVDHYTPGEEIPENAIESYFVWIPRYSYVLQDKEETFDGYSGTTSLGNFSDVQNVYEAMKQTNQEGNKATNHGFEIEFGSKDKGISATLLSKGSSIVHSAFEAFDSNGFWVGKFETGYNQNSDGSVMPSSPNSWSVGDAQQNTIDSTKVIIKPSVYSWRAIQVANAFYTSYDYKRELESHMMKNTEWGAVVYLTNSKYGRCDAENKNCSEVRINNVETYITGSSAKEEPTCGYTGTKEQCNWYETINSLYMDGVYSNNYYNQASKISSTTGNYSGIYDMAGGELEYVMGVMQSSPSNSNPTSGRHKLNNSGFKGLYSCPECDSQTETENKDGLAWPSRKYYDLYDYSTSINEYQKGILGDATKEMGRFYIVSYQKTNETGPVRYINSFNADIAFFVSNGTPWFARGGSCYDGTDAGVFAFFSDYGTLDGNRSFRVVLTP